jgi:branched-subunit amino acid aminotransferase/4-amino-4-deoxychorismate lyase
VSTPRLSIAGRPATDDDLRPLAQSNYGHFTAFRTRRGALQGLDLHLARLREGQATLFDAPFDASALLAQMRQALDGVEDASVRITGFARDFDYRDPLKPVTPEWLISVGDARPAPPGAPLALKSYAFVRPLPQIKHIATLPLFHYRRQARQAGADDALLVEATGQGARVVEGSVWNIGFWDGGEVLWPQGPALRGTCEALLQRGLDALGVPQRRVDVTLERAGTLAAFTANANGCAPVCAIDGRPLPAAPELLTLLARALDTQPWVRP